MQVSIPGSNRALDGSGAPLDIFQGFNGPEVVELNLNRGQWVGLSIFFAPLKLGCCADSQWVRL